MIRSPVSADVGVNLYIMEYAGTITRKPFRPVLISQAKIPKKCYTIGALGAIIARLTKSTKQSTISILSVFSFGKFWAKRSSKRTEPLQGESF